MQTIAYLFGEDQREELWQGSSVVIISETAPPPCLILMPCNRSFTMEVNRCHQTSQLKN